MAKILQSEGKRQVACYLKWKNSHISTKTAKKDIYIQKGDRN